MLRCKRPHKGRRAPLRWDTQFGRWVGSYGVPRIVRELGHDPMLSVTSHSVYEWLAGRRQPNPKRALELVNMSGGQLTLETIYHHACEMRACDLKGQREEPCRST